MEVHGKFVVVLNPYTRLVSLYNMTARKMPFSAWVKRLKPSGDGGCPFPDQKWKVHGAYSLLNFAGDGKRLLVDKVIKLGNLNAELPIIFKQLGIPVPQQIPRSNIGSYGRKGRNWRSYYDQNLKRIVQKLYGWELKEFHYNI